jgi:hypothetical protein
MNWVNRRVATDFHCVNGHPWTVETTYRDPKNGRHCRKCVGEHGRKYGKTERGRIAGRSKVKAHRQRDLLLITQYKLEQGCNDCGYRDHPEALELDHLPGSKKMKAISAMVGSASKVRLEAELAKCEVVCANCHRVRTSKRRKL